MRDLMFCTYSFAGLVAQSIVHRHRSHSHSWLRRILSRTHVARIGGRWTSGRRSHATFKQLTPSRLGSGCSVPRGCMPHHLDILRSLHGHLLRSGQEVVVSNLGLNYHASTFEQMLSRSPLPCVQLSPVGTLASCSVDTLRSRCKTNSDFTRHTRSFTRYHPHCGKIYVQPLSEFHQVDRSALA